MTPEPVSDPPLPRTLIDTTEGSTLAAMPAKDRGLLPEVDTGESAIVKPPSADVLLSWSRATPTPTPAPPKTSAAKPAAAAGANHAGRRRAGWTGSEGDGSGEGASGVVGPVAGLGSVPPSGQNSSSSLILVTLRLPVGQQDRSGV